MGSMDAAGYVLPTRRAQEAPAPAAAATSAPEADRAPPAEAPAERWRPGGGARTETPRGLSPSAEPSRADRAPPAPSSGGSFVPR